MDDLTVELLLDAERDGVYVALSVILMADEDWPEFPLRDARRYRDVRGGVLVPVVEPLAGEGFEPVAASEFIRVGDNDSTSVVALTARFYSRLDLEDDRPVVSGIHAALTAYERAYELGLATPDRAVRSLLR